MEFKASTLVAIFASCMLMIQALALPMGVPDNENADMSLEKRPKYMDTRDMSYFKDLFMYTLAQLIEDGKVSPSVLGQPLASEEIDAPAKRGRGQHLGFCVQVTPSGSYVARPCWKKHGSA